MRRRNGDAPTLDRRLTCPDAPKRAGDSNSTVTRNGQEPDQQPTPESPTTKVCLRCDEAKPVAEFPDATRNTCRECGPEGGEVLDLIRGEIHRRGLRDAQAKAREARLIAIGALPPHDRRRRRADHRRDRDRLTSGLSASCVGAPGPTKHDPPAVIPTETEE